MNIRLKIFLILSTIIILYVIIRLIIKESLQLKYSLVWIIIGFGLITIAIFPKMMVVLAKVIGIIEPVNALFFIGLIFELMIIFSLTIALSRNSNRVKILVEEVALLENKIRKLESKI